jgi:conflict system STAND superfamily ATPase/TIR domain-containing protein
MKTVAFCEPCGKLVSVEVVSGAASCPTCGFLLEGLDGHDVFISYASPDLTVAEGVLHRLHAAGIRGWLAPERIGAGDAFPETIQSALDASRVVVLILSSHAVRSPWVRREITDAISSQRPIVPLRTEEFELPHNWRFLLNIVQWEDGAHDPLGSHLDTLVSRIEAKLREVAARAATKPTPIAAAPLGERPPEGVRPRVSPYAGPQPFSPRMGDRFFGRSHEAESLVRLIMKNRVVLVYAPSGAGKTSLLQTLITQSLEDQGLDVLLNARVGGALPDTVKAKEIHNIYGYAAVYGLEPARVPDPRSGIADYLRSTTRKPGTRGRVVVFDQFEEIFTQHHERFPDRTAFVNDLVVALEEDPTLRVVFAIRQEYLADIDALTASLTAAFEMQRFALRRIDDARALEAITRPAVRYATFAPGVAEALVAQLNTIKVHGFDGVLVERRGEYIEMVHLQIVCQRLWASLPAGTTRIEMAHVERAAGDGKSFADFVVNALDAFYDDTIESVAKSKITHEHTHEHGDYPEELIRLGCMKFVTTSSTRTMVQRANGRTGRLPDWIVDQLEKSQLLRSELRGGERWYELSHDRLAEPVGRQRDRRVSALLVAADLLDKIIEKVISERDGTLAGYFGEHHDILVECEPFKSQAGLFADEAEFVLRASLAGGEQMGPWAARIRRDYPAVHRAVVAEALGTPADRVRRNAARLLAIDPVPELGEALVRLALSDPDESVRRAAAVSLARLDDAELHRTLFRKLDDPSTRADAQTALAHTRIAADQLVPAPIFDALFGQLPGPRRAPVQRQARAVRLREGLPLVPIMVVPAALLAAVAAAAYKWLPGMLHFALTQTPDDGAAAGLFHGLIAGMLWAGSIAFGLALYHTVFAREFAPRSYLRPAGALVMGCVIGFLGSVLVVLTIVSVYRIDSLVAMRWLLQREATYSRAFWLDLFVYTRLGWAHLITGTGLGLAMAIMTNALRASPQWSEFVARQTSINGIAHALAIVKDLTRIAISRAWPLPAVVAVFAALAYLVADRSRGSDWIVKGLIGDCTTQAIGAFFGIVGMGLGILVIRCGIHVDPRRG